MPPPEGTRWPGRGYGLRSFRQVLADAIAELSITGYVSTEQIERWADELRRAAEYELGPDWRVDRETRAKLDALFEKIIDRGRITDYVPGVSRFDLSMVKHALRAELDRRILAAADLIKLHRREAVERTLQRFRGWATAIPPGGDGTIDKRETRASVSKSLRQLGFERRRVDIDQGYKLVSNIAEIVAQDQGAIAAIWHDHGEHDKSYNARKEHLARSGKLFLVRDSWAIREGLVRRGSRPYTDDIERPGQAVFCRCWYQWITSPRRLPDDCLTRAGQEWVVAGRERWAA